VDAGGEARGARVGGATGGAASDGFAPLFMDVWLLAGLVKYLQLSWALFSPGFLICHFSLICES